jgi:hypothetical protein
MRISRLIAIASLSLFGLSGQASAATILDTTGGVAFNPSWSAAWPIAGSGGDSSVAVQFSLFSPGTVQSVEAYIVNVTGLSSINIGIMIAPACLPVLSSPATV